MIRNIIMIFMFFLIMGVFLPALCIIFCLGILPTFASALGDRSPRKGQTFCVGLCNVAGMMPAFITIHHQGYTLASALHMLNTPAALLPILIASLLGLAIHMIVPLLTHKHFRAQEQRLIRGYLLTYTKLKNTWGDSIPQLSIVQRAQEFLENKETLEPNEETLPLLND